jgi:hypothetical protein
LFFPKSNITNTITKESCKNKRKSIPIQKSSCLPEKIPPIYLFFELFSQQQTIKKAMYVSVLFKHQKLFAEHFDSYDRQSITALVFKVRKTAEP